MIAIGRRKVDVAVNEEPAAGVVLFEVQVDSVPVRDLKALLHAIARVIQREIRRLKAVLCESICLSHRIFLFLLIGIISRRSF